MSRIRFKGILAPQLGSGKKSSGGVHIFAISFTGKALSSLHD